MTERLREKEKGKKKGEEKLGVSVTLCHPAYRGGARFSPIFCLHKSPINNTINAYIRDRSAYPAPHPFHVTDFQDSSIMPEKAPPRVESAAWQLVIDKTSN